MAGDCGWNTGWTVRGRVIDLTVGGGTGRLVEAIHMRFSSGRLTTGLLAFAGLALIAQGLLGATGDETDCPAAFRPYSSSTPLLDLMINPATKAVVDHDLPGFLGKLPPILTGTKPPTLADVLTIKVMVSEFMPIPAAHDGETG